MKRIICNRGHPKFKRVECKTQFCDGFMISNCQDFGNKNLKEKLLKSDIQVNKVFTKNPNGNYWVMLEDAQQVMSHILDKI